MHIENQFDVPVPVLQAAVAEVADDVESAVAAGREMPVASQAFNRLVIEEIAVAFSIAAMAIDKIPKGLRHPILDDIQDTLGRFEPEMREKAATIVRKCYSAPLHVPDRMPAKSKIHPGKGVGPIT